MQLSASMLLGDENPDNVIYEREELIYPSNPEAGTQVKQLVAFKPRWECPVLDFTNATPTLSEVSGKLQKVCGTNTVIFQRAIMKYNAKN